MSSPSQALESKTPSYFWTECKELFTTTKGANKVIKVALKIYDIGEYIFKKEVLERFHPAKKQIKSFKELYSASRILDKLHFWVCAEDKNDPKKLNPAWLNSATSAYRVGSKFFILLAGLCKVLKFLDGTLLQLGKIAEEYSQIPVLGLIVSYPLKIYSKIFKFFANALAIVDEQLKAHQERKKIDLATRKKKKWNDKKTEVEEFWLKNFESLQTQNEGKGAKLSPVVVDVMKRAGDGSPKVEARIVADQILREENIWSDIQRHKDTPSQNIPYSDSTTPSCEFFGSTPYPEALKKTDEMASVDRESLLVEESETGTPYPFDFEEEGLPETAVDYSNLNQQIQNDLDDFQDSFENLIETMAQGRQIGVPSFADSASDLTENESFGQNQQQPLILGKYQSREEFEQKVQSKLDKWEFELFQAERRYMDTKLTTAHRVAKMAHALFSTIALLTGFGALPYFAINIGVKVIVRSLGYVKSWWRKTRPTTEETFKAFKLARDALNAEKKLHTNLA